MNEIIWFHKYNLISLQIRTDVNFSMFEASLFCLMKCFAGDSAVTHMVIRIFISISLMGK